jgi:hypothetical protein
MIRNDSGTWRYSQMNFGSATPISLDTIYDT